MTYNFTYISTFNIDYFIPYINSLEVSYEITDIKTRDNKYITLTTKEALTSTQEIELNQSIQDYSDFNKTIMDESILEKCKAFGRATIDEFEIRNMGRKDAGSMARQELDDIIVEAHDTGIFICLLEGSLDSLHGKLYGYPEQIVNGVTWAARPPVSFNVTREEDLDWMKAELNAFLATL